MKPELMLMMFDAPVTVRNFVRNDPLCNYEFYMVELLNHSKEMRKMHPQEFVWQGDQAHAECDAHATLVNGHFSHSHAVFEMLTVYHTYRRKPNPSFLLYE